MCLTSEAVDPFDTYAHFYDLDYADFETDLPLIQQFALRCGSPILELGCGTGRLVVPLASHGYEVTGVDVSAAMLAIARRKVAAGDLESRVTLLQQDMRELDLGCRFNMAFAAINSFMHMMTAEDQLAALARIRQHLNPGGILLLDLFHPDPARLMDAAGQLVLDRVLTEPDAGHLVMKFRAQTVDLERQVIHTTFLLDKVDGEGIVRRTVIPFSLRYLFRGELELLLRHAGYQIEAIYGSYDLDEFSRDSEKMIAVARRPD
jgi:SAM-dependent methyltransferase